MEKYATLRRQFCAPICNQVVINNNRAMKTVKWKILNEKCNLRVIFIQAWYTNWRMSGTRQLNFAVYEKLQWKMLAWKKKLKDNSHVANYNCRRRFSRLGTCTVISRTVTNMHACTHAIDQSWSTYNQHVDCNWLIACMHLVWAYAATIYPPVARLYAWFFPPALMIFCHVLHESLITHLTWHRRRSRKATSQSHDFSIWLIRSFNHTAAVLNVVVVFFFQFSKYNKKGRKLSCHFFCFVYVTLERNYFRCLENSWLRFTLTVCSGETGAFSHSNISRRKSSSYLRVLS